MSSADKIITDRALLCAKVDSRPRPLVFTNGCFDILHRGHVDCLERAAALGATLVVAVNSDQSVKRLGKGDDRPLNPLADRMAVLAALAVVDLVTAFDEDTPVELIRVLRPDHLVKGGDWAPDRIAGADLVRGWGGSVHSIPFVYNHSTSELLQRIRNHE